MTSRARPAYFALFVIVIAPIGAVVVTSALLLFGVHPRVVFAPGWALIAFLQRVGIHAPNAVGVAGTEALWWLLIVFLGAAWERVGHSRV